MAEERNNTVARAGNIANKLHGTAQVVRGALTADFVAVASGAVKLVSPKVIAGILVAVLLAVLMPVLVMFSLPQVLYSWGTLQDSELLSRHEHCEYLQSYYNDTGISGDDLLWLISIDAVRNNQDVMNMSEASVDDLKSYFEDDTTVNHDDVMDRLEFDDEQRNWAAFMFNTMKQSQEDGSSDLPIISGGASNGVPPEAYNDETFVRLINEAEKYLGYPYVFGGSSPSTSFDCSGFVCWVYTHSGVHNLPRTTAQGIYNQCTRVSASEAKPGDLIFFKGTYNAGETVTHVGIYVGNNRMLHCGNPIQYTSIDTNYWRNHFYAYGRL